MNQAWGQKMLEENEQAIILAESYRIAKSLGFDGTYEVYEKRLCGIINDSFSPAYQYAVEQGYKESPDEFCTDLSMMIYHSNLNRR